MSEKVIKKLDEFIDIFQSMKSIIEERDLYKFKVKDLDYRQKKQVETLASLKEIKLHNLSYALIKFDRCLYFKIIKPNVNWRCISYQSKALSFKAKNGWIIRSGYEMDFYIGKLMTTIKSNQDLNFIGLRGYDKERYKSNTIGHDFKTNKQRDEYCEEIHQALAEWDLHVELLKEKK